MLPASGRTTTGHVDVHVETILGVDVDVFLVRAPSQVVTDIVVPGPTPVPAAADRFLAETVAGRIKRARSFPSTTVAQAGHRRQRSRENTDHGQMIRGSAHDELLGSGNARANLLVQITGRIGSAGAHERRRPRPGPGRAQRGQTVSSDVANGAEPGSLTGNLSSPERETCLRGGEFWARVGRGEAGERAAPPR